MTSLRAKALGVLRSGRLTIIEATTDRGTRPHTLTAAVQSSRLGGPTYAVDLSFDRWSCTCTRPACAHIAAVQLVTGHAAADLLAVAS